MKAELFIFWVNQFLIYLFFSACLLFLGIMFCILVYKEYKEMLKFDILMLTTEG